MGSSGKAPDSAKSKNWYGTFGVAFHVLQSDGIHEILVDGKSAWRGHIARSSESAPITLENFGEVVVYWGTPTQTRPAAFAASGNDQGHDHPDYKDLCYILWDQALLGRERQSEPNVEAIFYRAPVQSLVTGPAALLDADKQANPICVLAELLENDFVGLHLAPSFLSNFQAVADHLYEDSATWYISPLLNQQTPMRSVVRDLLEIFFYGYLRWSASQGQLQLGYTPHGGTLTPATLLTANEMDEDVFTWDWQTWEDVPTQLACSFTDKARGYKATTEPLANPHAIQVRRHRDPKTLNRKAITRRYQAGRWLREWLKMNGQPGGSGEGYVRREKAAHLQIGDLVRVDIEPEPGGLQLQAVCKIVERSLNPVGPVFLKVRLDRSQEPVPYVPVADVPPNPQAIPDPQTVDYDHRRAFQLPPQLSGGAPFNIGVLISRTEPLTEGYHVLFNDSENTGEYLNLGYQSAFALRGILKTAIDASEATIDVELIPQKGLELLAADPGTLGAQDDPLLLMIARIGTVQSINNFLNIDADNQNRQLFELMAIESTAMIEAMRYDISVQRGRLGTLPLAFPATTNISLLGNIDTVEAWIFRRSALTPVFHRAFADLAKANRLGYVKLQTATPWAKLPVADAPVASFRFDYNDQFAPQFTVASPVNDAGKHFASVGSGSDVLFQATIRDGDGDLTAIELTCKKSDGEEKSLYHRTLHHTKEYTLQQTVHFADAGTYLVTLTAVDATGRRRSSSHTIVVSLAAGTVATPEVDAPGGFITENGLAIIASCDTSGATIQYAIVSHGTSLPGTWETYSGGITVYPGDRLWLRALKTGLTDSDPIYHDYFSDDYLHAW